MLIIVVYTCVQFQTRLMIGKRQSKIVVFKFKLSKDIKCSKTDVSESQITNRDNRFGLKIAQKGTQLLIAKHLKKTEFTIFVLTRKVSVSTAGMFLFALQKHKVL